MNDTPTSGPISTSITHQAREATSSRHSLRSNHEKARLDRLAERGKKTLPPNEAEPTRLFAVLCGEAALGERKHDLLEIIGAFGAARRGERRQVLERALAAHPPAAQQHKPIAHARRLRDLVNREEHRAA